MCAPAVVAGVTIAATVASTAVSIAGQQKGAKGQSEEAERNARLAEAQARDAKLRGAEEARRVELTGARMGAAATTRLAAGGVSGGTVDSPLTENLYNAEVDANRLRSNAAREAWGYEQQASGYKKQAGYIKEAGVLGSIGTGLSGLGSAAEQSKAFF